MKIDNKSKVSLIFFIRQGKATNWHHSRPARSIRQHSMLKNKIANRFVIYLNVTKWNLYEEISMFMINKLIKKL